MIHFSLHCDNDHDFEGWFGSSADFEMQKTRSLVTCPTCGSHKISKSLMAPSIGSKKSDRHELVPAASGLTDQAVQQLREIRKTIETKFDNVGPRFAEEARKIHYGETKERGIYGQTSLKEVKDLVEEGIGVAPMPELPEDSN